RVLVALEERAGGHQHARRAEAALQRVLLGEGFLHRVQLAALLQALDGVDAAAVGLHGEHRARLHRLAVELDRAHAAMRRVAADVGAGQAQVLADEVHQQQPRLDLGFAHRAVHRDADLVFHALALSRAAVNARPASTLAISRLYSTEPRRSALGDAAFAARRAASARVFASGVLPARNF